MPKRNVYVDEKLDREIAELDLPLSQICQRALRVAVKRERRLREVPSDIRAVAERLRADRQAAEQAQYDEGFSLGEGWARDRAPWHELIHFEPYRTRRRDMVFIKDLAPSLHAELHQMAFNENPDCFQEDVFEMIDDRNPYERGIIDGATKIVKLVKPLVEEAMPSEDEA